MDRNALMEYFVGLLRDDPIMSAAVAAIKTLFKLLEDSKTETLTGLLANLSNAKDWMLQTDYSYASINSGCEQFIRHITLANLQDDNYQIIMLHRGKMFVKNILKARTKAVIITQPFIDDGATILTHSHSRVVVQVLKQAANENKRFTVYVTESNPDKSGLQVKRELEAVGIPTTIILDAAIGYIMERVQLVMVGAEGVVESGGIINKIGTYPMAMCAKQMNKPVYVVAESFKFVRAFPLHQKDVPDDFKYNSSTLKDKSDLNEEHPLTDYTPPQFIDLMFTDLGVLTPSAVSDELIKLYC